MFYIAPASSVLALALALLAAPARSEVMGTLTLDSLSFVSFQDEQLLPLAGGTIRFHFGAPNADGSIPFRIAPEDVDLPEIALSSGEQLRYGLGSTASGTLRSSPNGHTVQFNAQVTATLVRDERQGKQTYAVLFTTESASASSGEESVSVTGMRVVPTARYVQIVGATVNKPDAEPKPRAAVYTVLSGSFDQLP